MVRLETYKPWFSVLIKLRVKFIYILASPQRDMVCSQKEEYHDQTHPREEEEITPPGRVLHWNRFEASRYAPQRCAPSWRNPLQKLQLFEIWTPVTLRMVRLETYKPWFSVLIKLKVKFIYILASPQRDMVCNQKEEYHDQTPREEEEITPPGRVLYWHQFEASRCAPQRCATS